METYVDVEGNVKPLSESSYVEKWPTSDQMRSAFQSASIGVNSDDNPMIFFPTCLPRSSETGLKRMNPFETVGYADTIHALLTISDPSVLGAPHTRAAMIGTGDYLVACYLANLLRSRSAADTVPAAIGLLANDLINSCKSINLADRWFAEVGHTYVHNRSGTVSLGVLCVPQKLSSSKVLDETVIAMLCQVPSVNVGHDRAFTLPVISKAFSRSGEDMLKEAVAWRVDRDTQIDLYPHLNQLGNIHKMMISYDEKYYG
jgi:hypothetical protein